MRYEPLLSPFSRHSPHSFVIENGAFPIMLSSFSFLITVKVLHSDDFWVIIGIPGLLRIPSVFTFPGQQEGGHISELNYIYHTMEHYSFKWAAFRSFFGRPVGWANEYYRNIGFLPMGIHGIWQEFYISFKERDGEFRPKADSRISNQNFTNSNASLTLCPPNCTSIVPSIRRRTNFPSVFLNE